MVMPLNTLALPSAASSPPAEDFNVPPLITIPSSMTCAPLPEARIRALVVELVTLSLTSSSRAPVPSAAIVPEFVMGAPPMSTPVGVMASISPALVTVAPISNRVPAPLPSITPAT